MTATTTPSYTPAQAAACLDALIASGWGPIATAAPLPEVAPKWPQTTALKAALANAPAGAVLTAHTDGACSGNPGPGGWAVVFSVGGVVVTEASGGVRQTTNNRMELQGAIEAVRRAPADAALEIVTDSRNVIGWLSGSFKRNKPAIVALGGEFDAAQAERMAEAGGGVTFTHVMGHQGNALNERADTLATGAIGRG